ncbi:MbtH family protein [Pseudonocardiaceae bacterium YIM PH 21723]|nr:MbtH family protein [Pseudonocardiaceae bacterium YIM PH 21723]
MTFQVVHNAEDQHSIWPAQRPLPEGWEPVGFQGTREECLADIELRWTDITPLSSRRS